MSLQENLQQSHKYFKGKKILVTGGSGFIGSHLVDRLEEYGAEVRVFDYFNRNGKTNVIYGDINNFQHLNKCMNGVEIVFHYAAILGVEKIIDIPEKVLEINLMGTRKALHAAIQNNVKKFIYASSSEIYGNPRRIPVLEDDDPSPISVYGISKLAGETYCQSIAAKHDIHVTILRYFNVYGPRQVEKFVMSNFISRVSQNLPPIIYGSGEQSRSYTFISDAIVGTLLAAALSPEKCQVYNIGNTQECTLNELAERIIGLSGKKLVPRYKAFGDGIRVESREIMHRKPNIEKAQRELGFEITTTLEEGIKRYYQWYIKEHKLRNLMDEIHQFEKSILYSERMLQSVAG
jgi:UDP-glucose 4-epimerase